MRPADIQQIGDELAIKWDDGGESYVRLEKLRRFEPALQSTCRFKISFLL